MILLLLRMASAKRGDFSKNVARVFRPSSLHAADRLQDPRPESPESCHFCERRSKGPSRPAFQSRFSKSPCVASSKGVFRSASDRVEHLSLSAKRRCFAGPMYNDGDAGADVKNS